MLLEIVSGEYEMNTEEQIIDLDFAVSQLSGNQSLLIKLLSKFNAQYENLEHELADLKQSQDFKAYKEVIHTVKGVSGNLGLNALHLSSKNLESSVINQADIVEPEANFLTSLNQTIAKINSLTDESSEADSVTAPKSSRDLLIEMLKNNEFITQDKLNSLLDDCAITETDKQELLNAIDDLDYAEALNVINRSS
ncbi:Hpt domain-containing protein [Aliiglaciecola sp. 3_MG-2023]|uniref:Hpt domain-containing protein n=1 Tax=Aliiglaciecola sp. 3_MG-2023 TaxID=3062644 RepID=UPI0026E168D0|nr:Hpt domain-containing protein [Aliiglaciecola sp. 3_MG-2023]MDO6695348.1 Hpt domain-containing protein [Aliiglaciecola sp. 3_MG-2023]